ncbi:cysteine desulfurase NifS [Candidatus Epulonipiscium fishelsonii]|uniref:Cysteine desulfurase NifS n=1 Tax=Candidatus Epulonipiscium fishelsonii TaxID=77094 RepID=A0ACC8XAF7_9FIRM|nr:cysteine desulfurase NifS [Epulopiscium sp. SCG-B11WGA-EpuloA1]ONI43514.1 cysteine desulfurase NifS [Epulopiscium sp. SCG-B05WGA-EpuloA1]
MIYFDHAATTPMKTEVLDAMMPYLTQNFGNPSSIYQIAQLNKKAIDEARDTIAKYLGAKPNEIYFTSGGTESDNWAIKGIAEAYKEKGNHIITSKIEHHAVIHSCEYLEKHGYEVTYLDVDENGVVDLEQLKASIRPTTILITIMYANNEIGTIMPVEEIGRIAKEHDIPFHTDAVQAVGQIKIDVVKQNIDMLSLSSHKINGPKGVGALFIRRGLKVAQFIHGGGQERGRRGGTENVAGIVGFGKAMELTYRNFDKKIANLVYLRSKLIEGILNNVPYAKLNGHPTNRLANNVNISFEFVEGESVLLLLDMQGICASSGSACTSGSLDPSHVLLSIGLPHEKAHGSVRMTLGEGSTQEEVDEVIEKLPAIIKRMRDMSPLYEEFMKKSK